MDQNVLRDHLSKLHEELGAARHVDPESNQLLGALMDDIKRLMRQPTTSASAPPLSGAAATDTAAPAETTAVEPPIMAVPESLPDRLEQIAVRFEANHPTLAASSRRLVDLLGKVGL